MVQTVRRALALRSRETLALARVLAVLVVVDVGLRLVPADRLARVLGVPLRLSPDDIAPPAAPEVVAAGSGPELAMLRRALRRWPARGATPCLREALAIGVLLRGSGPRLRLGVTRLDGEVFAHAWVEVAGHSLHGDSRYTPLGVTAGALS